MIFIVGGVTAHEIQLVHEFSQQIKKQVKVHSQYQSSTSFSLQVIIGSSGIMKPEDILSILLN